MELDYFQQKLNVRIVWRVAEQLKTCILQNWEIKEKSRKWLDFMVSTQRATKKHLYAKS